MTTSGSWDLILFSGKQSQCLFVFHGILCELSYFGGACWGTGGPPQSEDVLERVNSCISRKLKVREKVLRRSHLSLVRITLERRRSKGWCKPSGGFGCSDTLPVDSCWKQHKAFSWFGELGDKELGEELLLLCLK